MMFGLYVRVLDSQPELYGVGGSIPGKSIFLFVYNEDKVFAENFVSMFSYINALLSIGLENRMTG